MKRDPRVCYRQGLPFGEHRTMAEVIWCEETRDFIRRGKFVCHGEHTRYTKLMSRATEPEAESDCPFLA